MYDSLIKRAEENHDNDDDDDDDQVAETCLMLSCAVKRLVGRSENNKTV